MVTASTAARAIGDGRCTATAQRVSTPSLGRDWPLRMMTPRVNRPWPHVRYTARARSDFAASHRADSGGRGRSGPRARQVALAVPAASRPPMTAGRHQIPSPLTPSSVPPPPPFAITPQRARCCGQWRSNIRPGCHRGWATTRASRSRLSWPVVREAPRPSGIHGCGEVTARPVPLPAVCSRGSRHQPGERREGPPGGGPSYAQLAWARYESVELVVVVVVVALPPEPSEPWSDPPFCSPRSLAAADTHWLNGVPF
jgi:hypothetical protein